MMQAATAVRSTVRPTPSRRSSDPGGGGGPGVPGANEVETAALNKDPDLELERLRKDKIASIYEIEKYKKRISLAIVLALIGFAVAIGMVIWRFRHETRVHLTPLEKKVILKKPKIILMRFVKFKLVIQTAAKPYTVFQSVLDVQLRPCDCFDTF